MTGPAVKVVPPQLPRHASGSGGRDARDDEREAGLEPATRSPWQILDSLPNLPVQTTWKGIVLTNKETTQAIYDLFGKGDVPAILDLVTDDVTWNLSWTDGDPALCAGLQGKKGVAEFFRLIYANKDFPGFEVNELIGGGRQGRGAGALGRKSKKTGNPYSGDWAMVFCFGMESCTNTRSTTTPTARRWRPSRKGGRAQHLPALHLLIAVLRGYVANGRRRRRSHDVARWLPRREGCLVVAEARWGCQRGDSRDSIR